MSTVEFDSDNYASRPAPTQRYSPFPAAAERPRAKGLTGKLISMGLTNSEKGALAIMTIIIFIAVGVTLYLWRSQIASAPSITPVERYNQTYGGPQLQ